MAYLYHMKPGGEPECWVIIEKPLVLGRGEFADAYVDDDSLSRSHFLIAPELHGFFVIDLDSSNGTWIGGDLVCARRLESGDVIQAGDSSFFFSHATVSPEQLPTSFVPPIQPTLNNTQLNVA
jgi:pSer/pThr/pTyr-binding forkhead associated (FHA) protein